MQREYKIIYATSVMELEQRVARMVGEGWQLSGSPFRDEDTRQWCQAATRQSSEVNLKEPGKGGKR